MGQCVEGPKGTGGFVGTRFDAGGAALGGANGGQGTGAATGTGPDGGGPVGNGIKKCGCDVSGPPAGLLSILSVLVALTMVRRRTRC